MLVRTTQIDILNGFSDYFAVCSPNGNMILVCGLHMLYFAAGAVCDSDRGKWVAYTLFPFIVQFRQGALGRYFLFSVCVYNHLWRLMTRFGSLIRPRIIFLQTELIGVLTNAPHACSCDAPE